MAIENVEKMQVSEVAHVYNMRRLKTISALVYNMRRLKSTLAIKNYFDVTQFYVTTHAHKLITTCASFLNYVGPYTRAANMSFPTRATNAAGEIRYVASSFPDDASTNCVHMLV